MQYTGARILIEALVEQGVDTVFGYPGGAVLFIYDELFKHRDRIRHVLTSHEQHAAHAADGYARSTGKVGVCLATSGPGATNLVTGIATAYMDSVPMVAITGNVATPLLGKDSFQEVDIAGITMPVVKHNWIVKSVAELPEVVREAFLVAKSGRPGPVLIDIPKDITSTLGEWVPCASASCSGERSERLQKSLSRVQYSGADLEHAVKLLSDSKKPLIFAGGGVVISEASAELTAFAEKIKAPVATSLMAMGAFPVDHPLSTGMIGMHGTKASNMAAQKSDLLIAIGARFSDRVISNAAKFAPHAKVLHIDIDPAEINKNIASYAAVIGDVKQILLELLSRLPGKTASDWGSEIEKWQKMQPPSHTAAAQLSPRFILEETAKVLGREAFIATDVGQHQMWTAQFYPFTRPRSFLTSGGLGTMGYGLGAALGAQVANPGKPVVLFTGDGSFRMNCAEMGTLVNYHLPVLIVILNNRVLGMVRQWQTLFYEERYAETTLDRPPDFVKLAEAYGLRGFRADTEAAFLGAIQAAKAELAAGRPALVDARIDSDAKVLPMVAGGKPIDEQLMD